MVDTLKIHLDFRHKISLADQVQNQLRGLIQSGMLQSGNQLPTVRQLAAQLNINFNTVARAYRVLDEEGWISTQQGRGTYVLEASERERLQLNRGGASDEETAQHEALSPTDIQPTPAAAAPKSTDASSEAITASNTPISIDSLITEDSAELTAGNTSTDSNVSIASNAASAVAMPSAKDTVEMWHKKSESEKAKALNAWIEHLINEAAQNNIAVADLYQALGRRLVPTQANVEVSPRKAIAKRPIKQSRKLRHLSLSERGNPTPPIHALQRKKIKGMKK